MRAQAAPLGGAVQGTHAVLRGCVHLSARFDQSAHNLELPAPRHVRKYREPPVAIADVPTHGHLCCDQRRLLSLLLELLAALRGCGCAPLLACLHLRLHRRFEARLRALKDFLELRAVA